MKLVTALYEDAAAARAAVAALESSGFERDKISIVARSAGEENVPQDESVTQRVDDQDVSAAEGAGIGALEGGAIGLLAGLGAIAIPGLGPVLAAGPLLGALTGAVTGGLTGGLAASLIHSGLPEGDAHDYAEGVRQGGTLVTVQTSDERADDAAELLARHNPSDIEQRRASAKNPGSANPAARADARSEPVPVDNEARVRIYPDPAGGGSTAQSAAPTGARSTIYEPTRHLKEAELAPFREGIFEIPLVAEQLVVNKRARVVEEIVIGKRAESRTETIRETVRRTDVEIDEIPAASTASTVRLDTLTDVTSSDTISSRHFDDYEPTFRSHYDSAFSSGALSYDHYSPAYRYGYNLASDTRYQGSDWAAIEPEAREYWEEVNPSTWDQFRDAVRHAWESVTGG